MPTLHRGEGWKLVMYAGDHNPPHFHVLCSNGQECSIALGGLTVLAGSVDAKYREAALGEAEPRTVERDLEGPELMIVQFPRARRVKALEPYRLRIRWSTGETLEVELSEKLKAHTTLAYVLDPNVFRLAHPADAGASIEWVDAELGADNVYAWAREQLGEASHEMFHGWMLRNHLTLDDAAAELGLSRRMVAYYRSAQRRIPKHVWLACLGWESSRRRRRSRTTRAA